MNRRQFLKFGSVVTASTLLIPVVGSAIPQLPNTNTGSLNMGLVSLNNGIKMPLLGFGTYTLRGAKCQQCVCDALSLGYRLLDTATIYENEEFVGVGIKQSGVKREELFITSKVWASKSGYSDTRLEFEKSLSKMGTDYLDLYLIHRPYHDYQGAWIAMEELYREGRVKAIGVSNFEAEHLNEILERGTIPPAVNQIESHVFFKQQSAFDLLEKKQIQMEAWAPLAEGRNDIFCNDVLAKIGQKHNKTIAQICLRWLYQRGIVAIPRTTQKAHMIENLNIFDFKLSAVELAAIQNLDLNKTQFPEW